MKIYAASIFINEAEKMGKELFIRFTVRVFCDVFCMYFFSFLVLKVDGDWNLISS